MSYGNIDNISSSSKSKSIMHDISMITRWDIVKFFLKHKEDRFDEQESEELLNKLVKRKKRIYIFLYLDQYKLSDYNKLMDRIIDGWGWEYIVNYIFKLEKLNIKLNKNIAGKLENLWYWTIVKHHKNVFNDAEKKDIKSSPKWSYRISPRDPRNFYGC